MAHEGPVAKAAPHQPHSSTDPDIFGDLPAEADLLVIDCDRCSVRGAGCGDCVVTFLLGSLPSGVVLDDDARRAIDVLADAGLVPPLRMVQPLASRADSDSP